MCDNNKISNSSNSMVPDYQLPVVVSSLYELNTFELNMFFIDCISNAPFMGIGVND